MLEAERWAQRSGDAELRAQLRQFGYGGVTSYSAIIAVQRHISPRAVYLTTFAIAIIFFRLFFSHLGDRLGTRTLLYPSLALVPIAFAILGFSTTRWEMAVSAAVFGVGFGGAYPALATFIMNNTSPARRARTYGSIVWAFDIGIGFGSFALGAIGQHFGLGRAFLFAAALSCFAIPIFAWTSRLLAANGTSLAGSDRHAGPE